MGTNAACHIAVAKVTSSFHSLFIYQQRRANLVKSHGDDYGKDMQNKQEEHNKERLWESHIDGKRLWRS